MRFKITIAIAIIAMFIGCFADDLVIDCTIPERKTKSCEVKVENLKTDDKLNLTIPENFDNDKIKEMKFIDSHLEKIPSEIFEQFGDLNILKVGSVNLTELKKEFFTNGKNLKEIFASQNQIKELDEDVFQYTPELTELDLSSNQIIKIHSNAFRSNVKLEILDLSENQIKVIENNLFDNNLKLSEINFEKNQIYAIGLNIFETDDGKSKTYIIKLKNAKCTPLTQFNSQTPFSEISQCIVMYSVGKMEENGKEMSAKIANYTEILQHLQSEILQKQDAIDSLENDLIELKNETKMTQTLVDDYKLQFNESSGIIENVTSELDSLKKNYEIASIGVIGLAALCGLFFVSLIIVCTKKPPQPKYVDPESIHYHNNKLELKESTLDNSKSDKKGHKKEELLNRVSDSDSESESSESSSD